MRPVPPMENQQMPTYDFECAACGRRFELFLPMSADPRQPCPSCGRPAQRLIGAGGAVLMRGARTSRLPSTAPT